MQPARMKRMVDVTLILVWLICLCFCCFRFKKKTITIRKIKLLKLQFKVHNAAEAKKTYSEDLLHSQNALHKDGSQLVSDSRQQKPE